MKTRFFAILAVFTLTLAGCGLRDDPAVPPAKGEVSPPSAPTLDKPDEG